MANKGKAHGFNACKKFQRLLVDFHPIYRNNLQKPCEHIVTASQIKREKKGGHGHTMSAQKFTLNHFTLDNG